MIEEYDETFTKKKKKKARPSWHLLLYVTACLRRQSDLFDGDSLPEWAIL